MLGIIAKRVFHGDRDADGDDGKVTRKAMISSKRLPSSTMPWKLIVVAAAMINFACCESETSESKGIY